MIALLIAALAQGAVPQAPGLWTLAPDSTGLSSRSVEPIEPPLPGSRARYPARLTLSCRRVVVETAGPLIEGEQPFTYRVDRDRAQALTSTNRFNTVEFGSLEEWVRRLAGRDWLQVQFLRGDGVRTETFDLTGLDSQLPAFAEKCRVDRGRIEPALAARQGRPPVPQPVASAVEEHSVGDWRLRSWTDRFDDTRTVVASLRPRGFSSQALYVRAQGGRLEVFVEVWGERVMMRYDSTGEWRRLRGARGTGTAFFVENARGMVRDILAHRLLSIQGRDEALYQLAHADSALAPVLAAAGR